MNSMKINSVSQAKYIAPCGHASLWPLLRLLSSVSPTTLCEVALLSPDNPAEAERGPNLRKATRQEVRIWIQGYLTSKFTLVGVLVARGWLKYPGTPSLGETSLCGYLPSKKGS